MESKIAELELRRLRMTIDHIKDDDQNVSHEAFVCLSEQYHAAHILLSLICCSGADPGISGEGG
jgi:hypothetical protein